MMKLMTMVVVVLCRFRQLVSKDAPQWGVFHFYPLFGSCRP